MTEPRPSGLPRTIEAAAIAGLAHTALSLMASTMFFRAPEADQPEAELLAWYGDTANQRSMILGLNLLVIGSIAFIWFVAVIRRRIGEHENRFFGSVFLGSALVLVSSWLVAGILLATPALSASLYGVVPDVSDIATVRAAGVTMASVIATRLEAVFIISSTTVKRLSGAFPGWLIVSGYVVGATLMLVPLPNVLMTWIFPVWIAIVSLSMLIRRQQIEDGPQSEARI